MFATAEEKWEKGHGEMVNFKFASVNIKQKELEEKILLKGELELIQRGTL